MNRIARWIEDGSMTLALAALTLLPLAESLLRQTLHTGVPGSSILVQHLTLFIGMLGGIIAAREDRLLSLSTLGRQLSARWAAPAGTFGSAAAFAVTVWLAWGGWQFVQAERTAGSLLFGAVPSWWAELSLPVGFAAVAVRLVRRRIPVLAFGALFTAAGAFLPKLPGLLALAAATVLGIPVFATMGGAALLLFWDARQPIASIAIDHYSLVINPSLPTLPLFTLAGYLLAEGGAPRRMVRLFRALFGRFRGGSAIATAVACALFTAFTGASGVTIIALGGLLLPVLLADGFPQKNALGLVTGSGSLGLLLPPCLPLILYAIVAKIPMENMFLGGLAPGAIMIGATVAWGVWVGPKSAAPGAALDLREAASALWDAKWDLLLPVLAFLALFGGWATPVEAAALTALYALVSQAFIYGDLSLRGDVPRVMTECGLLVGGVLMILGISLGLTNYLVDIQVTAHAADWTTHTIHSPLVFLLALNVFLLIVGCLMDIYSAIVIQAPLLAPIAQAYGLDPVHVGIIFLANLELGYLTPPVGLNLFLSSYRFNKPLGEVLRAVAPMVLVLFAGVLLITYVPSLTTALPRLLGK